MLTAGACAVDAPQTGASAWSITGRMADAELAGGSVLALSSAGEVARAAIGADGHFTVEVAGGSHYVVNFLQDDHFVATLYFQKNRSSLARTDQMYLPVASGESGSSVSGKADMQMMAVEVEVEVDAGASPDGSGTVELGDVDIEEGQASSENNPGEQLDSDGDGLPDIDDGDDDGDGVPDDQEEQEDIDDSMLGFKVKKVEPEPGDDDVDTDEEIEIEFNGPADAATLGPTSVRMFDGDGNAVAYQIEIDDEAEEIEIVPSQALIAGMTYRVEVGTEVASADGMALTSLFSWQFTVESDDDDDEDEEEEDESDEEEMDEEEEEDNDDEEDDSL